MKIVLDTNVLMNGVQDDSSYGRRIIDAILAGKIIGIISHKIKRENDLITSRELKDASYLQLLQQYYDTAEWIRPHVHLNAVEEDHEDDKFVDTAVSAGAEYIVTSDSDLLDLGQVEQVKIITPQQFWAVYSDADETGGAWNSWMKSIGLG